MIPAKKYMSIVRDYALANQIPFFTWKQMRKALAAYECFASLKN